MEIHQTSPTFDEARSREFNGLEALELVRAHQGELVSADFWENFEHGPGEFECDDTWLVEALEIGEIRVLTASHLDSIRIYIP